MMYKFWKAKNEVSKGTIVFVHGYAETSDYFDEAAKILNKDYDYYAVELPGMGRTPLKTPKDLVPYRYAELVSEWVIEQDLKDFILIGHSMGGGIVNMIGTMIPERIKKIIAICPMSSTITFKIIKNARNISQFTPVKAYENSYLITKYFDKKYPLKHEDPGILAFVERNLTYKENFNRLFKNMSSPIKNLFKLRKAEKKISVPTLLITAEDDQIIDSKPTAKKLSKNSNVTWKEIKDSGHVPFYEQLQDTMDVILEFINK